MTEYVMPVLKQVLIGLKNAMTIEAEIKQTLSKLYIETLNCTVQ